MNTVLRSHHENPEREIDTLLNQLPPQMQDKVALIKSHIAHMHPAGLSTFVEILSQEVAIILHGENSYEQSVARILRHSMPQSRTQSANEESFS